MLAKKLIDFILPPRCGSCQKIVIENKTLCGDCFQKAKFITLPFCQCCGLPFDHEVSGQQICLSCSQKKPEFDIARFALPYDDFSKEMILSFKHGDRCDLAPLFAKWMKVSGQDIFEGCDIITPVPIHWRRLIHRKYNQSGLLAEALSHLTHIPCDHHLIQRMKNTKPQGHLSPTQRKKNLQGAFKCNAELFDKTVLLVDDVFTTGITLNNCAVALKNAKVREVRVLTLARVLKEDK